MATGFFALLDDIAMLMDDVAAASKTTMSETAGILGDDLAVNAEQAVGFESSRELPVLWAIGKDPCSTRPSSCRSPSCSTA